MKWKSRGLIALLSCLPGIVYGAEDGGASFPPPTDESAKFHAQVMVDGLDNPCGLSAAPRTGKEGPQEILFVESGAGRVMGFASDNPSERREVVTGLAVSESAHLKTRTSAWSLGFVTPTKLAVLGPLKDGDKGVAVYLLPAEAQPLSADKPDHQVVIKDDEAPVTDFAFPGIAFTETTVYLSGGYVEGPGQVFRAALAANKIEQPQPLLNIADGRQLPWPTGLCLSPATKMQFLVVALAGELTNVRDSRAAFIVPVSGKIALGLVPGLFDIVGLAYSPSGQLYAIDLAWENSEAGGVFRLDDARHQGQPACRAVKIADIVRPTSLLFGDNGTLYVTTWGATDPTRGTIVKVTGEF